MGWLSIVLKEFREHTLSLGSLAAGLLVVVLLSLAQLRASEFNMSGYEVVRFALITIIPLISLIVGNRLIVREYTGGTRKFVESLPIHPATPLIIKWVLGWLYLAGSGALLVLIATWFADAAEFIDGRYFALVLIKCTAIVTVLWSLVFFASFTGKIRLVIYLIIGASLMYLINLPAFDETRLAPVALMDKQLFVFEREIFPWRELLETGLLSLAFVAAGFTLALYNEGSVAEQLGKPLSRANIAAILLLTVGIFGVYTSLQEEQTESIQEFSGDYVLRSSNPAIEISYLAPENRQHADIALGYLTTMLTKFQADTGLASLPELQIAMNQDLEPTEVFPEYAKGVLVTANFTYYSYYEHSMMNTIALHHMLLLLTNTRWDFETRHWLLDGFARWWAEGAEHAPDSPNNDEHFARVLVALPRIKSGTAALQLWQTTTDLYGFETAGALAYTALLYLAEQHGVDTVLALAADYLQEQPRSSSVETLNRLFHADAERFKQVTGTDFNTFTSNWLQWVAQKAQSTMVRTLVSSVPKVTGQIIPTTDDNGVRWLEGHYTAADGYTTGFSGTCVLRHQRTSAFDLETEIYERERDRQPCVIDSPAHRVQSPYASGDRVYAVLEYENALFTRPIPLWTGRIHIK